MKNILIPVDGSQTSLNAAKEGLRLVEAFGCEATLLYILSQKVEDEGVHRGNIWGGNPVATTEADGYAMLEKFKDTFGDFKDKVKTEVILGTPTIGLEEYLKQNEQYDFLIMGSHGLGDALKRFLIGSTTQKILSKVHIPTLVVR